MKNIIKVLILLIGFTTFGQTELDFSAMNNSFLLGDAIGFGPVCDGSPASEYITYEAIDFNGHQIVLNNANFIINNDVQFGGSFKGYCESTICINGLIFNTDPPDPGGNPFDDENGNPANTLPEIPQSLVVNGCVTLPEGVAIGYRQLYNLFLEQRALSVNTYNILDAVNYDKYTKVLTVKNVDYIKVYSMLGQELIEGEGEVDLSFLKPQLLIIKTNLGTFKLIN